MIIDDKQRIKPINLSINYCELHTTDSQALSKVRVPTQRIQILHNTQL